MTEHNYPITPPPELVSEWAALLEHCTDAEVFAAAAQWGADQELEACIDWLAGWCRNEYPGGIENLRAARRPKPPSLKEIALDCVKRFEAGQDKLGDLDIIRRALEQLDD